MEKLLKSLIRDSRKSLNVYIDDLDTMIVFVEYYDWVLDGVNKKISEDLNASLMKEHINPLIKTLAVMINEAIKSSQMYETEIKRLVYNAQFTNAYTKLENALKDICNDVEGLDKVKSSNEIQKIKKYLENVKQLNLDTNEFKILYDKVQNYREIRNSIVHLNLKYKKQKFTRDTLDKRLVLLYNEIYVNDSSYIVDFLNDCKSFLTLIINEHNRVYPPNVQHII